MLANTPCACLHREPMPAKTAIPTLLMSRVHTALWSMLTEHADTEGGRHKVIRPFCVRGQKLQGPPGAEGGKKQDHIDEGGGLKDSSGFQEHLSRTRSQGPRSLLNVKHLLNAGHSMLLTAEQLKVSDFEPD
ncbi:UNVERIFIED_CONTAM: hypothetical protein K2H54_053692 [Gekko kuhli]